MKLIGRRARALPALFLGSPPSSQADELPAPHKNVHDACPGVATRRARVAPPSDCVRHPPTRPKASEEGAGLRHARRRRRRRDGAFSRQMGRWRDWVRQFLGAREDDAPLGWRRASQPVTCTSASASCAVWKGRGCCTGGGRRRGTREFRWRKYLGWRR